MRKKNFYTLLFDINEIPMYGFDPIQSASLNLKGESVVIS
jgi:hypothetical protein